MEGKLNCQTCGRVIEKQDGYVQEFVLDCSTNSVAAHHRACFERKIWHAAISQCQAIAKEREEVCDTEKLIHADEAALFEVSV